MQYIIIATQYYGSTTENDDAQRRVQRRARSGEARCCEVCWNVGLAQHPLLAGHNKKGNKMKIELKQNVIIVASGEQGEVIGRAEYTTSDPCYLVRYKCADGRAVEAWWTETALA